MTARAVALTLLAALAADASRAQDLEPRPFVLEERLAPGEVWSTVTAVRTRRAPVDQAGAVERSIGWTTSAAVLEHERGFALRSTLTAFMTGRREADVERVTVWREGQEGPWADPAARTWTVAFDPRWRPLEVEGPARSLERLLEDGLGRLPLEDGAGERPFARLRAALVERAGPALDAWVREVLDELLAPVQAVLARVEGGSELEPGATVAIPAAPGGPAGQVTYLGHAEEVFVFGATWDTPADQPREGGFTLDRAGRLTSVLLRTSGVRATPEGRAALVTREVVFEVLLVRPAAPPPEREVRAEEEATPR